MSVQLRVRLLPNGKWICEAKRWWQGWQGVAFFRAESKNSLARGQSCAKLQTEPPGGLHYPTCFHNTAEAADAALREAASLLGYENPLPTSPERRQP